MLGDPTGPQRSICLACAVPRRDDNGDLIRDARGHLIYHCESCIARYVDRWCECWLCGRTWLRKDKRTMATVADILKVAQSEVGYVESGGRDGRSGNITKFWSELAPSLQGQPWCAAFIRWTDKHAGGPMLPVTNPYYCPNLITYARHHGLWDTSGKYAAGAYVFYDFTGSGVAEHVERIVADDGVTMTTIGGNTSPDVLGSQANGGGVYRRQRPHGRQVLGALDYQKLLTGPNPAPSKPRHNPFPPPRRPLELKRHYMTGDDVRWVQWAVGCPVDGVYGPQTMQAVKVFQHYHGLAVDGVVGGHTIAKLILVTH